LQIGADLAEKDVRRKADRAGEAFADLLFGARAVGKVVNDDRADWRDAWARR